MKCFRILFSALTVASLLVGITAYAGGAYYSDVPHYDQNWFDGDGNGDPTDDGGGDCLPTAGTMLLAWHDAHGWPLMVTGGNNHYASNPAGVQNTYSKVLQGLGGWSPIVFSWLQLFHALGDGFADAAHLLDNGASWWTDDDEFTSWGDMTSHINNYSPLYLGIRSLESFYVGTAADGDVDVTDTVEKHAVCMIGYSENEYKVNASARWMILDMGWYWENPTWMNYDAADGLATIEIRAQGTPGIPAPAAPASLSATAVSSSQINLSWANVLDETGFIVDRKIGNGSWSQRTTRGANVTTFSDTGLTPETAHSYRVRAVNAAGESANSSTASATTQPAAGSTHTLTIASVNPSSGVGVSSYVGTGQYAQGNTPTSRTFAHGSLVGVNVWYSTLPSGQVFQKWQLDGADYAFTTTTTLSLDGNHTLTAVYGATALPPRTLSSLTVEGPSSVDEESSAQYRARATYSDGSSGYVTAEWDDDSGYASISDTGLLDANAVSSDRDIEIEATATSGGVTRSDTKSVTILNTDAVPTYTLTRNSTAGGSIGQSPAGGTFAEGTVVSLHGNPDDDYVFSHWSGDASGTEDDITIQMNGNLSVTAHFTLDTSYGRLQVNIAPPQAVAEGAQWKYSTFTAWRDSGNIQDGITPRTNKNINFKDIPGWITPDNIKASVVGGQTTIKSATYREIQGGIQVTITPAEAVLAGARWRLDGGTWSESGTIQAEIAPVNHVLDFLPISGWAMPASQTVTVARGITAAINGAYLPPAGHPVITAVYPKTGPIEGGTEVTIEGINFQPGTAVLFGGVPAVTCTIASASQVLAVTPPRTSYGTVSLSLSSGGHTATQANGFSYLNPLGSNIDLVGHFGGLVQAVDVVGNMAYYGEGPGLAVADFSTSSAPVERGRIAVPGVVKGVAVVSNVAFVAAGTAGIYAIDVSSSTAPIIVGFFDTEGSASGVTVSNGYAYVADGAAGLQILNITTPSAITRAGVFDTAGVVGRVSFGIIGSRKYAFLAEDVAMRVIDVTEPTVPFEVASVAAQSASGIRDVLLVGTKLFVSDWGAGVKIFNATAPSNLVLTGVSGNIVGASIDVSGNRLFKCDGFFQITDVSTSTPNDLGDFLAGSFCEDIKVVGTLAFLAMGNEGLIVLQVSNPSSISQRSRIQAVGAFAVQLANGYALVGDGQGMHSINIANAASPSRASSLLGDGVTDIAIASNGIATLVNMGASSVRIANVSNPSALSLSGTYSSFRASAVAQLGITPILAGQAGSSPRYAMLDILGVTTPSSPQRIGSLVLTSSIESARAVAIAGSWAFSARDSDVVDVVSLANPSAPVLTGTIPVSNAGRIASIAAKADANYVFVSRTNGVEVIDVSVKSAPLSMLVLDPTPVGDGWVSCIEVSGNRLFAVKEGFLSVYDIANPSAPELLGYYDIPGSGRGLAISNDLIFVAGNSAGVDILRLRDLTRPSITILSPTNGTAYTAIVAAVSIAGTASDDKAVARVSWLNDRGGGGVANGTTSWSITNVQLAAGLNRVTVLAEDANGNRSTDTIDIAVTLPDTTPPVVMITGPRPDDEFTVPVAPITLSGSVADNQSATGLVWSINGLETGTATVAGQNWSVSSLPLAPGPNMLRVTATDAAGNSASDTAVIFLAPPDTNAPVLSIEFPTLNAMCDTAIGAINLSGAAEDDGGVSEVRWANSTGGAGLADGLSPWSINGILLASGLNVIEISATDAAGNISSDSLAVTYTPPATEIGSLGVNAGVVSFDLGGPWGSTYVIETSTNLLQGEWTPLMTNTIPGEDAILITDPDASNHPVRFYRARSPGSGE